jgi:cytochrome c-type biogenesis protein CcmH/NrfG
LVGATTLLERLTGDVPGSLRASVLLARAQYIGNKLEAAQRALHTCLRLDESSADTYLLLAEISLRQGDFKEASNYVEQGTFDALGSWLALIAVVTVREGARGGGGGKQKGGNKNFSQTTI